VAPTVTASPSAGQVAAVSSGLQAAAAGSGLQVAASSGLPALGGGSKTTVSPAVVSSIIRRQVSHVRAEIRNLEKQLRSKHLNRATRRADARKLAALRRLLPQLLRELK
jgi:hypothetical protein